MLLLVVLLLAVLLLVVLLLAVLLLAVLLLAVLLLVVLTRRAPIVTKSTGDAEGSAETNPPARTKTRPPVTAAAGSGRSFQVSTGELTPSVAPGCIGCQPVGVQTSTPVPASARTERGPPEPPGRSKRATPKLPLRTTERATAMRAGAFGSVAIADRPTTAVRPRAIAGFEPPRSTAITRSRVHPTAATRPGPSSSLVRVDAQSAHAEKLTAGSGVPPKPTVDCHTSIHEPPLARLLTSGTNNVHGIVAPEGTSPTNVDALSMNTATCDRRHGVVLRTVPDT